MLFNSLNFALFLPIVYACYWLISGKTLRLQNLLLLLASYFFYACWDWKFLSLLAISTLLDYYTGMQIYQAKQNHIKKYWFWLSISVNLGFLCFFKYYNFFVNSFADALANLGFQVNPWTLGIIVPIGISFYTFHGLSYIIDIYNNRIKAEPDFINYAVFVSFFPLLVAGPIERATHLLPQIQKKREFDYAKSVDGLRQILWGLFKKVVIADQCSEIINPVFAHPGQYPGSALFISAVLFTIQIYADFSGYSDIALGTARLFGIELLKNFSFPYFSRSITEFWRRWHISLSSWFRDYVYIPLGGNKNGKWIQLRNTFIIFCIGGFWHGAKWTFVIWGILNALYMIPSIFFPTNKVSPDIVAKGKVVPTTSELFSMLRTFGLISLACIFFRSQSLQHAITYVSGLFSVSLFSLPGIYPARLFVLICLFVSIEWMGREQNHALAQFGFSLPKLLRIALYYAMAMEIFAFRSTAQDFIYFQF